MLPLGRFISRQKDCFQSGPVLFEILYFFGITQVKTTKRKGKECTQTPMIQEGTEHIRPRDSLLACSA